MLCGRENRSPRACGETQNVGNIVTRAVLSNRRANLCPQPTARLFAPFGLRSDGDLFPAELNVQLLAAASRLGQTYG